MFWQQLHTGDSQAAQTVRQQLSDFEWQQLHNALLDYDRFATHEIRQSHDSFRLLGQDNIRRYQPMTHIRIRLGERDSWLDIFARAAAVVAAGGRATISHPRGVHELAVDTLEVLTQEWGGDMEFLQEEDADLVAAIRDGQVDRLRYANAHVPLSVRQAADELFVYVAEAPVSVCGRVELLWYVREQSLCHDYHRYGNLGFRAAEDRSPVL